MVKERNQKAAEPMPSAMSTSAVRVVGIRYLAAGNLYGGFPVTEVDLETDQDVDWGAVIRPVLHRVYHLKSMPQVDRAGDFAPNIEGGVPIGPAVAFSRIILSIQQILGADVEWCKDDGTSDNASLSAASECQSRAAAYAVTEAAILLVLKHLQPLSVAPVERLAYLFDLVSRAAQLRQSARAARAAERLGIPWTMVVSISDPILALGQGKFRRLFHKQLTPETSRIGALVSEEKDLAGQVLRRAGLPVPQQRVVQDWPSALKAARSIGWPVCVKPVNANFGVDVFPAIADQENLAVAFGVISKRGPALIEEHIAGDNHRLLVFRGRCISVVKQTPAHVVGDGVHTIAQLVKQTNMTRSDSLSENWKKITIDDAAVAVLKRQGFELSDIPAAHKVVYLRLHTNLSVGGTNQNITATTHPDVKRLAVTAAALMDIDLAGVDFMTPDATRSYHEVGGAIVEVNVSPGFIMDEPEGFIEDTVFGELFPTPERGRIPLIVVMRENTETELPRLLARLLNKFKGPTALADPAGVWVGRDCISTQRLALERRVEMALSDPAAASAVIVTSPAEFAQSGLGVERVDVAVAGGKLSKEGCASFLALARLAAQAVASGNLASEISSDSFEHTRVWSIAKETSQKLTTASLCDVVYCADENVIKTRDAEGKQWQFHLRVPIDEGRWQDVSAAAAVASAMRVPPDTARQVLAGERPIIG